jgi:zinc D-Ala-D-Ala dipeptidase
MYQTQIKHIARSLLILFISYLFNDYSLFAINIESSLTLSETKMPCLVNILSINSKIKLDIRYATSNNFLGFPIYNKAACYLHLDSAQALNLVQIELESIGLRLKVFDGYRPLHIQQLMWDTIQDEKYVSNPAVNKGRHTRGTAIDLTLIDQQGNELEMGSEFDAFTDYAHSDCDKISLNAYQNRQLLKSIMKKYGFSQFPYEWWHFDFSGWNNDEKYPPLNLTFEELENKKG